jgi:hypothetical protein
MSRDLDERRTRQRTSRISKVLVAIAAIALGVVLAPSPASAGWADGDITNNLPSSYTVKIADLGNGQMPGCSTWNAGWFTCTHWWLPSGKADGQIGLGSNFDTDAFMVENRSYLLIAPNVNVWRGAGVWTKISDFSNVSCDESNGSAVCIVDQPIPSS